MMKWVSKLSQVGPGALVAAAFIGPGTVTVCTLAGAQFGYALIWALVFATLATMVLQEMSGRLGTVAGKGLGEALRERLQTSAFKWPLFTLVLVALYAGNAAYQAGNLSGAALGVDALTQSDGSIQHLSVLVLALLAGAILMHGSYKVLERVLITLVIFMGLAFIGTFLVSNPDWGMLLAGLLKPSIPQGSLITIIALIGTTVVPYNLFLHASTARARWAERSDLAAMRSDAVLSIGLGGLVAIFIVSTAAAGLFAQGLSANSVGDMAVQLEPLFGVYARYLLGAGLLAAGLSSALTAPMATAFAVTEVLGYPVATKGRVFRGVALSVLFFGAAFALSGVKPITIILLAQFANGLLLPIAAAFLIFTMNDKQLLGQHANGVLANSLGALVFIVSIGLGARLVFRALGLL